ncbi:hypothetical protein [Streptomyces viridochromogenes]|uniref:hypothetical protein n=1 Tax=Streptomyces viridochromogenes TaxID=1938 RepID=UPI0011812C0D|nr:hypothetical protein [Streptomyces viridochromogenes]
MDLSDQGAALDSAWVESANNIVGILHGCRDASPIAERFVRASWRSRSSSWYGYEVGTSWCEVELDPVDGPDVLLNGVVAPHRFEDLTALLHRFGLTYTLELYEEDGTLIRESRG